MKYEKRPGLYLDIKNLSIELYWLWYFEPKASSEFDINCLEAFIQKCIPQTKTYQEPRCDKIYHKVSVENSASDETVYGLSKNGKSLYVKSGSDTSEVLELLYVLCS